MRALQPWDTAIAMGLANLPGAGLGCAGGGSPMYVPPIHLQCMLRQWVTLHGWALGEDLGCWEGPGGPSRQAAAWEVLSPAAASRSRRGTPGCRWPWLCRQPRCSCACRS